MCEVASNDFLGHKRFTKDISEYCRSKKSFQIIFNKTTYNVDKTILTYRSCLRQGKYNLVHKHKIDLNSI